MTQSNRMKRKWQDLEWRWLISEKVSESNKKRIRPKRTSDSKKKTSETIKKWHENMPEDVREERNRKLSEATKRHYEKYKLTPEYIEKVKIAEQIKKEKEAEKLEKKRLIAEREEATRLLRLKAKEERKLLSAKKAQEKEDERQAKRFLRLKIKEEKLAKKVEKPKKVKVAKVKPPKVLKVKKEPVVKIKRSPSEITKEYYSNPENRKAQSERLKKYYSDPEKKRIQQEKATAALQKPEIRKKMSDARFRYVQSHPESRIKTKEHLDNISKGISQAILDGKMLGYYKKSKRGTYLSPKSGEVYFRSAYELKAFVLLDEDENVISYKHDAFRVPYINEKSQNRYFIIDLVVQYKDGSIKYIEVKPKDFRQDKEVIIKLKAAENLLGDKFAVWNEEILNIKDPHTLYNELIPQLNGRLKIK